MIVLPASSVAEDLRNTARTRSHEQPYKRRGHEDIHQATTAPQVGEGAPFAVLSLSQELLVQPWLSSRHSGARERWA